MPALPTRDDLRLSWRSWVRHDLQAPQGPAWLQGAWTLLASVVLAAGFTLLGALVAGDRRPGWDQAGTWLAWYGRNLVVCLAVSVLIHALHSLARLALGGEAGLATWRPWQRHGLLTGIPVAGLLVGWPLGLVLAGFDLPAWLQHPATAQRLLAMLVLALLMTLLLSAWSAGRTRQMDAERRAAEARLRLLQGQIEPHFLFNTLAGVVSLIEVDPPRARRMLQDFTDHLRAALGALRQPLLPLDHELDLVRAYLALMAARLEDRLQFQIDADAATRGIHLPPLLLQPLVENAVVHGIEPSLQGGRVQVTARLEGGQLLLEVRDTGCGLPRAAVPAPPQHHGMALDNLRARLQALYGPAASLELASAEPGTRVRLRLPLQPTA